MTNLLTLIVVLPLAGFLVNGLLGNRLGKRDVMKAARVPQLQENVMTIAVEVDEVRPTMLVLGQAAAA